MANDSVKKTLIVTVVLSLVCSIVVSSATVLLKPMQDENKQLDVQRNILAISGLTKDASELTRDEIQQLFKNVEPSLVDLETGNFYHGDDIDPKTFDQRKAANDPNLSVKLAAKEDPASIKRRSKYGKVYLVKESGHIKTVVIPIHGYGLWSTLYGFMALDADMKTVVGFGFYEHGETPGLGGEVDNEKWKAQWVNKEVYDAHWQPVVEIVKGGVIKSSPKKIHQVDGLSGATLTSRGVEHLVNFWLGDGGFVPFLKNLRKGVA